MFLQSSQMTLGKFCSDIIRGMGILPASGAIRMRIEVRLIVFCTEMLEEKLIRIRRNLPILQRKIADVTTVLDQVLCIAYV